MILGAGAGISEGTGGKKAYGACHTGAVEFKILHVGTTHLFARIHFHAGNDVEEVLLLEIKFTNRPKQGTGCRVFWTSREQAFNLLAPLRQLRQLFRFPFVAVGNVVHLAAKGVYGEHAVTPIRGQNAHAKVKRGAGGLDHLMNMFTGVGIVCHILGDTVHP